MCYDPLPHAHPPPIPQIHRGALPPQSQLQGEISFPSKFKLGRAEPPAWEIPNALPCLPKGSPAKLGRSIVWSLQDIRWRGSLVMESEGCGNPFQARTTLKVDEWWLQGGATRSSANTMNHTPLPMLWVIRFLSLPSSLSGKEAVTTWILKTADLGQKLEVTYTVIPNAWRELIKKTRGAEQGEG